MTLPERVQADYETMNLTTGPHPMKLLRDELPHVWRASDLRQARTRIDHSDRRKCDLPSTARDGERFCLYQPGR